VRRIFGMSCMVLGEVRCWVGGSMCLDVWEFRCSRLLVWNLMWVTSFCVRVMFGSSGSIIGSGCIRWGVVVVISMWCSMVFLVVIVI